MASKASCRMGFLRHTKSVLGTPKLLSTYKTFIRSLMEYSSPLWAGPPASHFAQLDAVETKAFKINGISHDEAESIGLTLRHRRQVGGLCLLPPPFWSWTLCPLCVLSPTLQVSTGHTSSTLWTL